MSNQRTSVPAVRATKRRNGDAPLAMMTAYDEPTARLLDAAGVDLLLVGDSVANVVLGHDDTLEIASNLLDSFDFNPEERQTFREFLDGPIEVHILLEPIDRDFHELDSHQ